MVIRAVERPQDVDDPLARVVVQTVGRLVSSRASGRMASTVAREISFFSPPDKRWVRRCSKPASPDFPGQGPLARLVGREPQAERAEGHVFSTVGKKLVLGVLEHKPTLQRSSRKSFFCAQYVPVKTDQPLLRPGQSGDAAEKSGLAAAVGAVEADFLRGEKERNSHRAAPYGLALTGIGEVHLFQAEDGGFASAGKRGVRHAGLLHTPSRHCPPDRAAGPERTARPRGGREIRPRTGNGPRSRAAAWPRARARSRQLLRTGGDPAWLKCAVVQVSARRKAVSAQPR